MPVELFGENDALEKLDLDSTLQDINPTRCQLEMNSLGKDLESIFDTNQTLPGIVLTEHNQFIGMVSRRRFLEVLSRPYGRELFLERSLHIFYRFAKTDLLTLSGKTKIVAAAQQAIQRSSALIYEPIVVQLSPVEYGVLDTQKLLIVQSHLHQLTTQLLDDKTQAQLLQTEKLAMLGQMLAGVAHEIRNPVACIVGNIQCLSNYTGDLLELVQGYEKVLPEPNPTLEKLKEEIDLEFLQQDVPELLQSLQLSSQRLTQLVTSLRGFSRTDQNQRQRINIHNCLDDTLLILKNRLKSGIKVIKHYGNLPESSCYPGQLSQVFMNLIANAIDALEEQTDFPEPPMILIQTTLKTGSSTAEENPKCKTGVQCLVPEDHQSIESYDPYPTCCQSHPIAQTLMPTEQHLNSRYISIRIIDNGPGIPTPIQDKIFENFFTTKPVGKGTGLGLTISHQIITQHHQGKLNLKSTVGQGTEFEILLPL